MADSSLNSDECSPACRSIPIAHKDSKTRSDSTTTTLAPPPFLFDWSPRFGYCLTRATVLTEHQRRHRSYTHYIHAMFFCLFVCLFFCFVLERTWAWVKRTRRLRRWACSGNWTLQFLLSTADMAQAAPMPDIAMPDMALVIGFMFMAFMFMPAMFMLTDGPVEPISRLTGTEKQKQNKNQNKADIQSSSRSILPSVDPFNSRAHHFRQRNDQLGPSFLVSLIHILIQILIRSSLDR